MDFIDAYMQFATSALERSSYPTRGKTAAIQAMSQFVSITAYILNSPPALASNPSSKRDMKTASLYNKISQLTSTVHR